jgi:acyl-CoA synthetase (NDP forming)
LPLENEADAETLTGERPGESGIARALARLLQPRSIAIAGASPDPATMGGVILANCERFGFVGDIHLISPTRDEISGRPCVRSVDDLPEGVDALVLNVPRAAILPAVEAAARRGVGGVIVFASGFAEAGADGQREQDAIAAICRRAGMALLGPNCMGYVNYAGGMALTFEPVQPQPIGDRRSVAVIAQSGAAASGIRSGMQGRGISVALQAAIGNEAVVRASDLIDRIVTEGHADAIALYVEQIRDPGAFLAAVRRAHKAGVPVVMMHPGRSKRGQEAAQSHTGSMVGDYALMRTSVENEAVVAIDTMDELFDALAILHRYPAPSRGEIGIVTNSGAIRGMAFDFAEDIGLPIADISGLTLERLGALLPAGMEIDNPLDVGTTGFAKGDIFGLSTAAMLADPSVSGVLLPMAGGGPSQQRAKADAIIPEALGSTKPVVVAITGDESVLDPEFLAAMRASETPLFRSPERAMRAFGAVRRYAAAWHGVSDRSPPATGLARWAQPGVKPEYQGKEFLRSIGVRVPEGGLATTVEEGLAIAAQIGFPVVLKAQAAALSHKSDVGGVVLNLRDEAQLHEGWARMTASLRDTALDGVLVEQMSAPGLELVVGARNHPEWGPSVMVGLGGVLIEALDAAELLPADISHARAVERILALRGAKLLGEFRGRSPRDVDAVADVVVKVGAAMRAGIGIEEIDINPLMVLAKGEGAVALDALIVTGA